jgi:hypothetical protein
MARRGGNTNGTFPRLFNGFVARVQQGFPGQASKP